MVSVPGVELTVLSERAKPLARMPCLRNQRLDQLRLRWVPLHQCHVAEERDRVMMEDPVVLAPDEGRHGWTRDLGEDGTPVAAKRLQIVEQAVVVAALLVHVL